jgi:hypothetical protein
MRGCNNCYIDNNESVRFKDYDDVQIVDSNANIEHEAELYVGEY